MQAEPRFLTKAEDALLRLRYPNTSTKVLAAEMGLTTDQVSNYAKGRKLYKSDTYKEAEKAKTMARLSAYKRAAAQRRLAMSAKDTAIAMRIQATPAGESRKTAHGTAYSNGVVTVHVMR